MAIERCHFWWSSLTFNAVHLLQAFINAFFSLHYCNVWSFWFELFAHNNFIQKAYTMCCIMLQHITVFPNDSFYHMSQIVWKLTLLNLMQVTTIFICWRLTYVNDCVLTWKILMETGDMLNMTTSEWALLEKNTCLLRLEHTVEMLVSVF